MRAAYSPRQEARKAALWVLRSPTHKAILFVFTDCVGEAETLYSDASQYQMASLHFGVMRRAAS